MAEQIQQIQQKIKQSFLNAERILVEHGPHSEFEPLLLASESTDPESYIVSNYSGVDKRWIVVPYGHVIDAVMELYGEAISSQDPNIKLHEVLPTLIGDPDKVRDSYWIFERPGRPNRMMLNIFFYHSDNKLTSLSLMHPRI